MEKYDNKILKNELICRLLMLVNNVIIYFMTYLLHM